MLTKLFQGTLIRSGCFLCKVPNMVKAYTLNLGRFRRSMLLSQDFRPFLCLYLIAKKLCSIILHYTGYILSSSYFQIICCDACVKLQYKLSCIKPLTLIKIGRGGHFYLAMIGIKINIIPIIIERMSMCPRSMQNMKCLF